MVGLHEVLAPEQTETFAPDLAVAALTLVPLILITSALSVGLLRKWSYKIEKERRRLPHSSLREKPLHKTRRFYYAIFVGCGMCLAAIVAMFASLVELTWHTNSLDMVIFVTTSFVTAGIGVALFGNIVRALAWKQFPEADVK